MDVRRLAACPHCGSGDVRWCAISVRPYCAECKKFGRANFGSAEDAVRDWNRAARFAQARRAEAAERDNARLREALEEIARQKRTDELETEADVEFADFEGGYDMCIDRARNALRAQPGEGSPPDER